MRLLFLNYEYPPLGGGAANATARLLDILSQDSRFVIDLICSSLDIEKLETISPTVTLHRLDIGKHGDLHYQTQKDLLRYAWAARAYAAKLHREQPYDGCLAFFGIPCGVVARSLRIPYIVSLRGSDVPFYNPRFAMLDRLLFQRLSRRVWRDARAVVANSEGLRTLALNTAPHQRIPVIPNGVDTARFHPAPQLPATLEILTVARLIPRKGIHHLISALSLLPPGVRLTIAGSGTERESLERLARQQGMGAQVRFLGPLPNGALPEVYRTASVFVLPSLNEGMSNTVLEAMASGLPLVLTDTGGTQELLSDGVNGFVVEKECAASIASALRRYVEQPELLAQHGAESRRRAGERSWSATAQAYAALFEEHFGGKAHG